MALKQAKALARKGRGLLQNPGKAKTFGELSRAAT